MTDNARPSKPDSGRPLKPSRAMGSRKGDEASQAPVAGRLKLKAAADTDDQVRRPAGRGPVKEQGREPQPRTTTGRKAKPTDSPTAATTRNSSGPRGEQD